MHHCRLGSLITTLGLLGCNGATVTGKLPGPSACEQECRDEGLSPFPMNLVVLTSDPTAPNGPATTISSCSTNDTTWPCVHPNSLNKYFAQDNPASLPNICAVPGDTTTCVSFQYQQHFNNASLGTPTDPNCQAALALADSATWGSTTYTNFDDYSLDLAAYVRACSDLRIYDPSMANVYLYTNPFDSYTSFNAGRFVDMDDNQETEKSRWLVRR